ncbi:MAG: hypothetical protein LN563_01795 [Rickettsia endosymbiont of Platyusa sonomae]|nr:hypothetical protein [Rickettsia endosymbiont of Platyusa sonomae]
MNYQDIIAALRNDPNFDEVKVKEALNFAIKHYRDNNHQFIEIAKTITSVYPDTSSTIAALLFFSFAKANLKASKIQHFNTEISKIFNALTKLFQIHNTYRHDTIQETIKLLLSLEPDIGIRVLLIRFAYLLNQIIFDSKVSDIEYYLISNEISKIYVPLFQEVTIENIKTALQDACLTILHPQLQELIVTSLTEQYPNQQQLVISTINTLHDILSVVDIAYTISGRVKSYYSIAKKIVQKSSKVTELFDIIGIRVIVEEEGQCYKILDTIYNNYKHIPKRCKDFIKFPKKSGYQSLHTVIVKDSQKIEVQIRTKRMHHIALFGSASHLQYKMPSIRTNTTLHSVYDLLNKYILDILNPFTINIRLNDVRIANESVALRSEVTWLITQDIEISQLHYRFSYQEHAAYYVAEIIAVNTIEVNQLSRQLVNIDDRIDIDAVRTSQIQEQYLANIRTSYQEHDNLISGVNKQVDHNQQYAEALLNKPPYIKTDLPLDNMDNDYRDNHSIQNNKKSNTLEVIKNNATIIPDPSIELLEKLPPPEPSQETVTTHYQDIDWYSELISLKSKTSTNAQNDCSVPISTEEFLQITSARELAGDTERKITTYIDVAENLCPDSKTKLSAAIDLPKISIRLPAKVAYVKGFERDSSPQTAVYSSIWEDSSTPLLSKLPAELESCRDYIKSDNTSNYINTAVLFGDKNIHDLNKDSWRIPIKTIASILQKDPITIDLRDEKIKDSDIEALISLIKDTNIIHLNLGYNYITGIEIFASTLRDTKITHLNLQGNQIAEDCAKTLVSILKDTQIIYLNLSGNNIGDTSISSVENDTLTLPQDTKITYLDLGYNSMGDAEIKTLASILQNTQITYLNLAYNQIGNSGAIALASILQNTQITYLNLAYNQIGNLGAIELASVLKDTKITKLILDGNLIDNKGIKELISIQKNTKIIITFKEQQKETYDSGYSACEEDIEDYNLQNMEIKGSDIEALVPLLKDSISTHIDLKHNYINTFVEQNLHSVEECEPTLKTRIMYLDLEDNARDSFDIKALTFILKHIEVEHLNLACNRIGDDNDNMKKLANILKDTKIKHLDLQNNLLNDLDIEALVAILPKTNITHLNLNDNEITTKGAKILIDTLNNTKLEKLDLKHNYIEDKDIVTDQKPIDCQIDFDDQKTIYPGDFYPGNFPKLQNITYPLQDRIKDNSSPVSQVEDKFYHSTNHDYQKRLVDEKSELLGETSQSFILSENF